MGGKESKTETETEIETEMEKKCLEICETSFLAVIISKSLKNCQY